MQTKQSAMNHISYG